VGDVVIPGNSDDLPAFVTVPEQGAPWPGVVALHDVGGMSEDMRNRTSWLAREGFMASVPNLYF